MRSLYVLALLLVTVVAWAYWTPMDVSFRSRGVVRPSSELVRVVAETGGRITAFPAHEGQWIRLGDTLVALDSTMLRMREQALLSMIHYSERRLADLDALYEADVQNSDAALMQATARHNRTADLFAHGLVPRLALEETVAALDGAMRATELVQQRTADSMQRTPLLAGIAADYKELERIRLEITRLNVTAPVSGKVTSLAPLHVGETLASGAPLATILPEAELLIVESWVVDPRITAGQTVRIRHDDSAFAGVVASVSPDVRQDGARRVVVRTDETLQLGRSYDLHFVTSTEPVLMLLFHSIRREFRAAF